MVPKGKLFALSIEFFVKYFVNTFHSENKKFDNTLNALQQIALLPEKESNEYYNFVKMLKQMDASDSIHTMIK